MSETNKQYNYNVDLTHEQSCSPLLKHSEVKLNNKLQSQSVNMVDGYGDEHFNQSGLKDDAISDRISENKAQTIEYGKEISGKFDAKDICSPINMNIEMPKNLKESKPVEIFRYVSSGEPNTDHSSYMRSKYYYLSHGNDSLSDIKDPEPQEKFTVREKNAEEDECKYVDNFCTDDSFSLTPNETSITNITKEEFDELFHRNDGNGDSLDDLFIKYEKDPENVHFLESIEIHNKSQRKESVDEWEQVCLNKEYEDALEGLNDESINELKKENPRKEDLDEVMDKGELFYHKEECVVVLEVQSEEFEKETSIISLRKVDEYKNEKSLEGLDNVGDRFENEMKNILPLETEICPNKFTIKEIGDELICKDESVYLNEECEDVIKDQKSLKEPTDLYDTSVTKICENEFLYCKDDFQEISGNSKDKFEIELNYVCQGEMIERNTASAKDAEVNESFCHNVEEKDVRENLIRDYENDREHLIALDTEKTKTAIENQEDLENICDEFENELNKGFSLETKDVQSTNLKKEGDNESFYHNKQHDQIDEIESEEGSCILLCKNESMYINNEYINDSHENFEHKLNKIIPFETTDPQRSSIPLKDMNDTFSFLDHNYKDVLGDENEEFEKELKKLLPLESEDKDDFVYKDDTFDDESSNKKMGYKNEIDDKSEEYNMDFKKSVSPETIDSHSPYVKQENKEQMFDEESSSAIVEFEKILEYQTEMNGIELRELINAVDTTTLCDESVNGKDEECKTLLENQSKEIKVAEEIIYETRERIDVIVPIGSCVISYCKCLISAIQTLFTCQEFRNKIVDFHRSGDIERCLNGDHSKEETDDLLFVINFCRLFSDMVDKICPIPKKDFKLFSEGCAFDECFERILGKLNTVIRYQSSSETELKDDYDFESNGFIFDLFYGQLRTKKMCMNCSFICEERSEVIQSIHLEIGCDEGIINIQQCINNFFQSHESGLNDRMVDNCCGNCLITSTKTLARAPQYLLFHLTVNDKLNKAHWSNFDDPSDAYLLPGKNGFILYRAQAVTHKTGTTYFSKCLYDQWYLISNFDVHHSVVADLIVAKNVVALLMKKID